MWTIKKKLFLQSPTLLFLNDPLETEPAHRAGLAGEMRCDGTGQGDFLVVKVVKLMERPDWWNPNRPISVVFAGYKYRVELPSNS